MSPGTVEMRCDWQGVGVHTCYFAQLQSPHDLQGRDWRARQAEPTQYLQHSCPCWIFRSYATWMKWWGLCCCATMQLSTVWGGVERAGTKERRRRRRQPNLTQSSTAGGRGRGNGPYLSTFQSNLEPHLSWFYNHPKAAYNQSTTIE